MELNSPLYFNRHGSHFLLEQGRVSQIGGKSIRKRGSRNKQKVFEHAKPTKAELHVTSICSLS